MLGACGSKENVTAENTTPSATEITTPETEETEEVEETTTSETEEVEETTTSETEETEAVETEETETETEETEEAKESTTPTTEDRKPSTEEPKPTEQPTESKPSEPSQPEPSQPVAPEPTQPEPSQPEVPAHTHNFTGGDCSHPSTCNCGATGEYGAHNWSTNTWTEEITHPGETITTYIPGAQCNCGYTGTVNEVSKHIRDRGGAGFCSGSAGWEIPVTTTTEPWTETITHTETICSICGAKQ